MDKTNKKEKMTEDVLQDQTVAPTTAQPATDTEVADASMEAGAPAVDNNGEVPAEQETPVGETQPQQPATFTAPVAGMVPSGWINPSDLAQAVAQETGDVQAAETAPDVQTAEDPNAIAAAPTDVNAEQPLVANQTQNQVAQPQLESLHITKDELDMILEYRKYKANKLVEEKTPSEEVHSEDEKEDMAAGGPDVVPTEAAPIEESSETCPECGKNPCECDTQKVQESEEAPIEEVEEDTTDANESVEEPVEDTTEELPEVEVADEIPTEDEVDTTETDELMDRINAFLDDDSEEGNVAAAAFDTTADYLDSLFDETDDETDDSEEVEDDIDVENDQEFDDVDDELASEPDESEFVDDETDEVYKDTDEYDESNSLKNAKLHEDIIYPSGSEPESSVERQTEAFEDADNLVEAYKRESARKREALNSYRNALNGSSRVRENVSSDKNSWSNNRFEDKFEEHAKFDYKELLKNGFLG